MAKINWSDKVDKTVSSEARINKVVAADMNEIKDSINAIYDGTATLSGGTSTSFSATTLSGGTIYSGATNLETIIRNISDEDTFIRVQPGVNITTGGTDNLPVVNLTDSPSVNDFSASGTSTLTTVDAGSIDAESITATTVSADTIYSGSTDLEQIIRNISDEDTFIRAQDGINTFTGGTETFPTVNLTGASLDNLFVSGSNTSTSFSANTLSGGTIYSGNTDLEQIIRNISDEDTFDITRVQPGVNITTGGTDNLPVVNLTDSPSVNDFSASGTSTLTTVDAQSITATTLSGGTIYSGSTDIETLFLQEIDIADKYDKSGGTISGNVNVSNNLTVQGDFEVLGTATTLNTETIQTSANTFTFNVDGTHLSAINGGLEIISGQTDGSLSTFKINSQGSWNAVPGLTTNSLSGVTIFSGNTDLEQIIRNISDEDTVDIVRVQDGTNTFTGGTDNFPTVNVTGLTIDNLNVSGNNVSNTFSATTISADTIYSNSTPFSGNPINGAILPVSGSNTSTGSYSFVAGGQGNTASGTYAHAEGINNLAQGSTSHSEGNATSATTNNAHSEGTNSLASGNASHAEGNTTVASNSGAHAEGQQTTASGQDSHAEGRLTNATNTAAHAEGLSTTASGTYAHSEGQSTTASGAQSHAEGLSTTASGLADHAEGQGTEASGDYGSHAEGYFTTATGWASHSEGGQTTASGNYSHAEGKSTVSSSDNTHAEGRLTSATTSNAHAEGQYTLAQGTASHAEGRSSQALGNHSHAEGYSTTASGNHSHAGGERTTVSGIRSFGHSSGSTVTAQDAVILGGTGNTLTSSADRSVILGGGGITGNQPDTVYGVNFNASGSISASTLVSGSTDLEQIIRNISDEDTVDVTRVQPGTNITTGGTDNFPVVNLTDSPAVNDFTVSGTSTLTTVDAGNVDAESLTATTLSADTIYSGSTDLSLLFGSGGGDGDNQKRVFEFYADTFESPNNTGWTVNSLAPVVADSINAGINVRRFDDTTEEGVGFTTFIPSGVSSMTLTIISRAQTAPTGATTAALTLYEREIPNTTTWSSAFQLTDIDIDTDTNFNTDTETISLSTLGVASNAIYQFELTRDVADAGDTLTDDLVLYYLKVEYS